MRNLNDKKIPDENICVFGIGCVRLSHAPRRRGEVENYPVRCIFACERCSCRSDRRPLRRRCQAQGGGRPPAPPLSGNLCRRAAREANEFRWHDIRVIPHSLKPLLPMQVSSEVKCRIIRCAGCSRGVNPNGGRGRARRTGAAAVRLTPRSQALPTPRVKVFMHARYVDTPGRGRQTESAAAHLNRGRRARTRRRRPHRGGRLRGGRRGPPWRGRGPPGAREGHRRSAPRRR